MQCIDDRYTLSYETHFRKYAVQYYAFFVFTEERLNYTTVQAGFFQNQKANTDLKNWLKKTDYGCFSLLVNLSPCFGL